MLLSDGEMRDPPDPQTSSWSPDPLSKSGKSGKFYETQLIRANELIEKSNELGFLAINLDRIPHPELSNAQSQLKGQCLGAPVNN